MQITARVVFRPAAAGCCKAAIPVYGHVPVPLPAPVPVAFTVIVPTALPLVTVMVAGGVKSPDGLVRPIVTTLGADRNAETLELFETGAE